MQEIGIKYYVCNTEYGKYWILHLLWRVSLIDLNKLHFPLKQGRNIEDILWRFTEVSVWILNIICGVKIVMAAYCSFFILYSLENWVNANRVTDGKSCAACMGRKGNQYNFGWKSCGRYHSWNGVVWKLTAMKKIITMWNRLNGSTRLL